MSLGCVGETAANWQPNQVSCQPPPPGHATACQKHGGLACGLVAVLALMHCHASPCLPGKDPRTEAPLQWALQAAMHGLTSTPLGSSPNIRPY